MIKVNGNEVKVTRFPDGTFKFDLDLDKTEDIFIVFWQFESMEELFTIQSLKYFINDKVSNYEFILYMPYVPNGRMDKVADDNEGFMLKYFANIINSLKFDRVVVLDPHSKVTLKLIDNSFEDVRLLEESIQRAIDHFNPDIIVFPDKGAFQRYSKLEVFDDYKIAYGIKERNQKTGEIISFDIEGNFKGVKNALIVDDICSKGGTFYYTSLKLREKGLEEVNLYVTHLEEAIKEGELLKSNSPINRVMMAQTVGAWNRGD